MTVVSYAHQMILLKTRKTAGTSVELWLSSIAGPDDVIAEMDPGDEAMRRSMGGRIQNLEIPLRRYRTSDWARWLPRGRRRFVSHMPACDVRQYVGKNVWDSFLKVTIERDPYDRALSMYRFKTRGLSQPPSLVEFLRRFPAYKLANAPIYTIDGGIVADVVLDYANLAADVVVLQRHLGVNQVPLPRAKSFARPAREVRDLLVPEARRIVDSACRYDLALEAPEKRIGVLRR